MRIAITGASGLIGSGLVPFLSAQGHEVTRLVRGSSANAPDEVAWGPAAGTIDSARLEGIDAVVHLAAETISKRWTRRQKAKIRESRVRGTRLLCEALARLKQPPRVLVSASAVGYYGNRGDQVLDELSSPGGGFLADVCREWEAATQPLLNAGVRVAHTRFGVVLSPEGGALKQMLPPFRMGFGGRIGNGRQYLSWITRDDVVGAIHHVLTHDALRGPVNVTSPNPATNAEFTKALGRALSRPTVLPLPAAAARLIFGQMADELLLSSARVVPTKLLESGYAFQDLQLEPALRRILDKAVT
jgi:uncharacterized protein (TIGR01777 family)